MSTGFNQDTYFRAKCVNESKKMSKEVSLIQYLYCNLFRVRQGLFIADRQLDNVFTVLSPKRVQRFLPFSSTTASSNAGRDFVLSHRLLLFPLSLVLGLLLLSTAELLDAYRETSLNLF